MHSRSPRRSSALHHSIFGIALLSGALALAACGTPEGDERLAERQHHASPLGDLPGFSGPVAVLDAGHWAVTRACSGFCVQTYNFWVDMAVRNDSYRKQVGILWTRDGWASQKIAYASFKGDLGNGYERWGLDVEIATQVPRPSEIEYAVFAMMGSTKSWDPRNNYHVYQGVTPRRPVRRLSGAVHYEASAGAVLTGEVRVLDIAYAKQVTVRLSTDGWKTHRDVDATWTKNNDWTFRAELSPAGAAATLPKEVAYAIRYRVDGVDYWDNNNKADYRHQIAPTFEARSSSVVLTETLSGRFAVTGRFVTHLPIDKVQHRLDGGAWIDGATAQVDTTNLADGVHNLEHRLLVEGGYETIASTPLKVKNRLQLIDAWQLSQGGKDLEAHWGLGVDGQGRYFTLPFSLPNGKAGQVLRYASHNTSQAPLVFDPVPQNSSGLRSMTVCGGHVYGLAPYQVSKGLYRYDAQSGQLDASYGQGGYVDLSGTFDGKRFCFLSKLTCGPSYVYVSDSCNHRILRFSRQNGAFESAVAVPKANGIPGGLYHDGSSLWVLQRDVLRRYDASPSAPMSLSASAPLTSGGQPLKLVNPAGLTRAGSAAAPGLFFATGMHRLVAIDASGVVQGSYVGAGSYSAVRTPTGDIAVVAKGEILRFKPLLL